MPGQHVRMSQSFEDDAISSTVIHHNVPSDAVSAVSDAADANVDADDADFMAAATN